MQAPRCGSCSAGCSSISTAWAIGLNPLQSFRARENELHHRSDCQVEIRVLDHGHACSPRPLDDVVLDEADVPERVDVALDGPKALRDGVAHPEVALVRFLVLDLEDA